MTKVSQSSAADDFDNAMTHTNNLVEGTKTGRGRPDSKETSMFVASVALAYAAWEAYIEDVAIEAVAILASTESGVPDRGIPDSVRRKIEGLEKSDGYSHWQLYVHPGWRHYWVDLVRTTAKGDTSSSKGDGLRQFGMNTADRSSVLKLFGTVGIDLSKAVEEEQWRNLDKLVDTRSEVVHTAKLETDFNKKNAVYFRDFVEYLTIAVDRYIGNEIERMTGSSPW